MNKKSNDLVLNAANDNAGGANSTRLALQGLVTLLARAEVQAEAARTPANNVVHSGPKTEARK